MQSFLVKKMLFLTAAVALTGCAVAPQFEENVLQQVRASVAQDEGAIKFSSVAIWLPNSKGDFNFMNPENVIKGVAVITEKSFLFQQWGGPTGLSTIKRIPFEKIQDVSMNTFGRSARLAIRSERNIYDSFAVSNHEGLVSIRDDTTTMYEVLHARMKTRSSN